MKPDTPASRKSYKDYLARNERKRVDGTPAWPLTDADVPSRLTGGRTVR